MSSLYSVINKISFPGLSDYCITIKETAFTIPGINVSVAWYGLIITFGIILAFLYVFLRTRKLRLISDDLFDIAIFTVIPGIIGARLYYVFFDWLKNPHHYTKFTDVIAIWNGGLAIYGGIIFGALGCILTLKYKRIRIPVFFDTLAPAVMLAQSIGRWGNFCNGEAYGSPTDLPWSMRIDASIDGGRAWFPVVSSAHPTFLYESLWNLIGFLLLAFVFYRIRKFDGQITLGYLSWYGFGRMFIEGLRTDSLYIGNTGIRVSQLIAFLCFIIAGACLLILTFGKYRDGYTARIIYRTSSKYYPSLLIQADCEVALAGRRPEDGDEGEMRPSEIAALHAKAVREAEADVEEDAQEDVEGESGSDASESVPEPASEGEIKSETASKTDSDCEDTCEPTSGDNPETENTEIIEEDHSNG